LRKQKVSTNSTQSEEQTSIPFYTVEHWQDNWDALLERVEQGETIGVENLETGDRAVMVPADDELIRLYTDHNEGS
jgi:hypothetical protein